LPLLLHIQFFLGSNLIWISMCQPLEVANEAASLSGERVLPFLSVMLLRSSHLDLMCTGTHRQSGATKGYPLPTRRLDLAASRITGIPLKRNARLVGSGTGAAVAISDTAGPGSPLLSAASTF